MNSVVIKIPLGVSIFVRQLQFSYNQGEEMKPFLLCIWRRRYIWLNSSSNKVYVSFLTNFNFRLALELLLSERKPDARNCDVVEMVEGIIFWFFSIT